MTKIDNISRFIFLKGFTLEQIEDIPPYYDDEPLTDAYQEEVLKYFRPEQVYDPKECARLHYTDLEEF